ncbi:recombinase family protein [Anatilimnocola floriformis]|uniref:recombinase family protein n=1 Tax=Anatilimnocola floriformis TaxID=2948575 RepID=UPI0020C3C204|nr:recombinase family protein [Anatilimnocola floriformis]
MSGDAYSYVRFSAKKQELGRSQKRQAEAAARFCERHNLKLSPKSYQDLGVSSWKGKNFHEGALGAFLTAVKKTSSPIKRGSVLVVESLDRISRASARKALRIMEEIIEAGVTIATLDPERSYDEKSLDDPFSLIEMILVFVRANEESNMKSMRVRDAWTAKRMNAANAPMTTRGPAWLIPIAGGWKKDERKAESVRTIIRMSADGNGAPAILQYLHDAQVPNPSTGKARWSLAYVQLLMRDRRIIGELQPCVWTDGKQQPVGPPLEDYYPAICDLDTFARAQSALANRRKNNNTKQGNTINLFGGLMIDPESGSKWIVGKKAANKPARLQTMAARNKVKKSLSVDYDEVEKAVLRFIEGLDLEQLLPHEAHANRGRLGTVEQRIAILQQRIEMDDPATLGPLMDTLAKLEAERQQLKADFNEESALRHSAVNAHDVIDKMRKAKGDERKRLRLQLRTHLATVIRKITMTTAPFWRHSIGILDIELIDGILHREITHQDIMPVETLAEIALSGLLLNDKRRESVRKGILYVAERGFTLRIVVEGGRKGVKLMAVRPKGTGNPVVDVESAMTPEELSGAAWR